ncbi:MAG TPA: 5-bromo-4-chloroindolyl phosphate hydrolysis family protein [Vicinamibacterales bacterium]
MTRLANPLRAALYRGRVWAPATKAAALFVLPAPLALAALAALINGDLAQFGLAGGALGSIWTAGALAWRGAVAEARYLLNEQPDLPRIPFKLLSAATTAGGATLAALAGDQTTAAALVFGGLGAAGHLAFFGRDLRPPRIRITTVDGVDAGQVRRQLEQAHARLRRIESAARSLAGAEFRERLLRVTRIGRDVLTEIEHDPRDAIRARRFLNLYLESAEGIALEYARTNSRLREPQVDERFRRLLGEMERTFTEQHRRLTERDLLSLDVDMEVLDARLKQHGPG